MSWDSKTGVCRAGSKTWKARQEIMATPYGRLRVIGFGEGGWIKNCICRCACGATKVVIRKHLVSGAIQSCGCLALERVVDPATLPATVSVFGEQLTLGELAWLADMKPAALWARMRRGASAEEAAFGTRRAEPKSVKPTAAKSHKAPPVRDIGLLHAAVALEYDGLAIWPLNKDQASRLKRLESRGWISDAGLIESDGDEPRQSYRVTDAGHAAAKATP